MAQTQFDGGEGLTHVGGTLLLVSFEVVER